MPDVRKMASRFVGEYGFSLVMAVVLVAASVTWVKSGNPTVRHVAEAIGVAALLGLTVDPYVKRRLSREIAKDVAPLIFAYGRPGKIADEIEYFRRITCFQQNLVVNYDFEELRDNYIRVLTQMTYEVVNLSDEKEPWVHAPQVLMEKYGDIEPARILGVEAAGEDIEFLERYSLREDEIPTERKDDTLTFKRTVHVRPNKDRPSNRFWCKVSEPFLRNDHDFVFVTTPAVGVTIRVHKPPGLLVSVAFGHRNRDRIVITPAQEPNQWFLDSAFPPWTWATVSWRPSAR
jgi:hypothetical protein